MNRRIIGVLIGISLVGVLASGCSNNSVAKESNPAISIPKTDENKPTKTDDTTTYNADEVAKEKAKSSIAPKEINTDEVGKFVRSLGYEVGMNSMAGYWTVLPKDFNELRSGFEIGKFLKERNQASEKNGFNFSQYMGKEIAYVTCGLEKQGNIERELIAFLSDGKIVGVWTFDSNNKNNDHMLLSEHLEQHN